jgi:hypothetical protein
MKENLFFSLFLMFAISGIFLMVNMDMEFISINFPKLPIDKNLPPDLTWGILLTLIGIIFLFINKVKK